MSRVSLPDVIAVVTLAFTQTLSRLGGACPDCPVGRAARQQVAEDGLAANLLIAMAPFVIIGLVSLWAERLGKTR